MKYNTAYNEGVQIGMAEMERRMRPQRVVRRYSIEPVNLGGGPISGDIAIIETFDGRTWAVPDESTQALAARSPHLRKDTL